MKTPDETRGQRIKRLRIEKGMSRLQLAVASGAKSVDQIKANEEKNQRPGNLAEIATALETTVHYLETGEDVIAAGVAARMEAQLAEIAAELKELRERAAPSLPPPPPRGRRRSK